MISAEAWRMPCQNDSLLNRLQVNGVPSKSCDKLLKAVKGWRESGVILHRDGQVDLLYSCDFEDEQKWIEWAKNFPYDLVEVSPKTGKAKAIKLGAAADSKTRKKRKTKALKKTTTGKSRGKCTCSKCGKKGHNSRSCPNPPKKEKPKKTSSVKRQITCKICGKKGHNSRSCATVKTL